MPFVQQSAAEQPGPANARYVQGHRKSIPESSFRDAESPGLDHATACRVIRDKIAALDGIEKP
jgi:hypothetical protein